MRAERSQIENARTGASRHGRRKGRASVLLVAALAMLSTILFVSAATGPSADAQVIFDETKLTASDGPGDGRFGRHVAVSGDTMVVGAPFDDDKGFLSGSAYVFTPDGTGGYAEIKLTASDAVAFATFGSSVAVSGDTIVIGSGSFRVPGSVYVFEPDGAGGYTETARLTAPDGAPVGFFGNSVAVSGDTIVIGAGPRYNDGRASGAAYVFTSDGAGGYTETAELIASNGAEGDRFGGAVAVSGDMIVIGASGDSETGQSSGAAYVFTSDGAGGYTETARLTASDAAGLDLFGVSVGVSGETVVIGAYWDDDNGMSSGSAYVFEPDGAGGYTETKITASDGAEEDLFGQSVAVSGDTIVIGARWDDTDNGNQSGSAYVFRPDAAGSYTETAKLTASDGAVGDALGESVAISGDTIVLGAPGADPNGSFSGAAYVYERGDGSTDSEPPVARITNPVQNDIVEGRDRTMIAGTVTDNVGVVGVQVAIVDVSSGDFLQPFREATLDAPGAASSGWTFTVELRDGDYRAIVRAQDTSRNSASLVRRVFSVETSTDPDTKLRDFTNPVAAGTVTFSGRAADDEAVESVTFSIRNRVTKQWLQDDGTFAATYNTLDATMETPGERRTNWDIAVTLTEPGPYRIAVKATDNDGNTQTPATTRNFFVAEN